MKTESKTGEMIFGTIEMMFMSMLVVCLIFTYFLHITRVSGVSMENTLSDGDTVIMTAFRGSVSDGDIVVINADEAVTYNYNNELVSDRGMDRYVVKRVIATEGQTVDIDFAAGAVYVDGKQLHEPYISSYTHLDEGGFTGRYPLTVPEGYVFVLGDNRRNSLDSRSDKLGFVKEEKIIGEIFFSVSPFGVIE